MNKDEFNKLIIDKQVEEFNRLIKEHNSIRGACGSLGIGKTTIRDRFKKHGYSFINNKYVRDINIPVKSETPVKVPVNENKVHIDITDLEQTINRIVDERLSNLQKKEKSSIRLSSKCEGDVKYRSFGVYKVVSDEFDKYAKKHLRYSKIELISQAMIEFMMNHN